MTYSFKGKLILFTTSLIFFGLLAYTVNQYETLSFDSMVTAAIYSLRNQSFTLILTAITYTANWEAFTLICIILLLLTQTRRRYGLPLTLVAIASTMAYEVLKPIFSRARPDLSLHLISQGGFSFPSGHAMTSLVFFSVLLLLLRLRIKNRAAITALTVIIIFWIFLIGFSRVYLGVHYPTDILGGWSLGICIVIFSEQVARIINSKIRQH